MTLLSSDERCSRKDLQVADATHKFIPGAYFVTGLNVFHTFEREMRMERKKVQEKEREKKKVTLTGLDDGKKSGLAPERR